MQSPLVNPSTPISTPTKALEVELCRDIESNTTINHSTPILFQGLNKLVKRPPRVNFHSIDDIVYGGETKTSNVSQSSIENESGYSSFNASNNSTPSFQKCPESENVLSDNEESNDKENRKSDGKKARTTFTDEQKKSLDIYFQKNPYPDPRETEELSRELVLPENVIKVWFQNKRSRDKQRKFSNRSRVPIQFSDKPSSAMSNPISSPLVTNLQLLSSRFNSYLAAANNYHNSFQSY